MAGGKLGLLSVGLALGGCAERSATLTIKPVNSAAATKLARSNDVLSVARGELALGNVGLALEAFRKAQLRDPTDPAAPVGIAECYASMGRFDLARANYEAALALAPHDRQLLAGLANVFEHSGQPVEAAALREEAQRSAVQLAVAAAAIQESQPVVALAAVQQPQPAAAARPSVGSITVALPPISEPAKAHPIRPVRKAAIADAAPVAVTPVPARPAMINQVAPPRPPQTIAASGPPSEPAPRPYSITVKLPPVRAMARTEAPVAGAARPHLERLSRTEVSLITTALPTWAALLKLPAALAPRREQLAVRKPGIKVLNAAGRARLAASARDVLESRGWRRISVDTARTGLARSIVLYPVGSEQLARSLGAQFAVSNRRVHQGGLTLVLGADRAMLAPLQKRA